MILYAESSAVLAWLLGEPGQDRVLKHLETADRVATSTITAVECSRALARARHDRRITSVEERAALHLLDEALASWHILDLADEVVTRARAPLPAEPVRSLDAIHIASAWMMYSAAGELTALSLDERVRANVRALGMTVAPEHVANRR
jgi:predicted nucleic acid-binding protein